MQHAILHVRLGEIHLSETGIRYLDATALKDILSSAPQRGFRDGTS